MPLPFIIGGLAAIAGIGGAVSGVKGAVELHDASTTMSLARTIQERAEEQLERKNRQTNEIMDTLGTEELKILKSFNTFSELVEQIHNKPDFRNYRKVNISLPTYNPESLREVSAGAGVLLGGLSGAAIGTAGGLATAGMTTSAVMALGTASTGTAISSLSGVAATNATLAALGGGSIAAGGGGMALGASILSGATMGAGLLAGGLIFNIVGTKLSDKADEALSQAQYNQRKVDEISVYLDELKNAATPYVKTLKNVSEKYFKRLKWLDLKINLEGIRDWNEFSSKDKDLFENLDLLVGLLYKMCRVQFMQKDGEKYIVHTQEITKIRKEADYALGTITA